jgi:penicillin-binding protein 1A
MQKAMARTRGGDRTRQEPTLDEPRSSGDLDLRLNPQDRPGREGAKAAASATQKARGRAEPTFEPHVVPADEDVAPSRPRRIAEPPSREARRASTPADEDLVVAKDEDKGSSSGGKKSGKGKSKSRRRKRGSRSFLVHVAYWGLIVSLWGVVGLAGFVAWHFAQLPPIDQLTVPKRPPNIAILASDGSLIANKGDMGGRAIALKELPSYLPKAFIAIEDRRFYGHSGIDPVGIARALIRNVTSRGVSQGGSTLTQQLAKNLFLTQERTLSRKVQEAILSVWLEKKFSKNQIIELYLNRVYFGSGAYGVEAAAQRYFGKSARDVTLAEAAVLAGLVQAPSRLAPTRNPDAAQARAQLVLTSMAGEGFISDRSAKAALMTPAEAVKPSGAGSANYAADYVMDMLDDFVGEIDKDIVVATTLDPVVQAAAEKALVDELDAKGAKFGVSQGAVVTLASDGAVKALVGGRNYADSQFNRAATARRQPGSSFKPFVYLAAIERGLTPDTVREDSPVTVGGWSPENYSRRYSGPMTLTTALANSINTVAVKLCVEVGPKAVVGTARRLGITSALQANASIALGTSEVAPIEMAAAYAAFANGGTGVIPYVIKGVKGVDGKVIYKRAAGTLGPVIDPTHVGMMNAMLRETLTTGTARKADLPGWDAAGKTGTSNEFRDAWFIGYTSGLVTAVWLGNDDGTPTKHASGSSLPVDIWSRTMKAASRSLQPAPLPGGSWRGSPGGLLDMFRGPTALNDNAPRDPGARDTFPPQRPTGAIAQRPLDSDAETGGLRPPVEVPRGGPPRRPPPREQSFFEKLFGG